MKQGGKGDLYSIYGFARDLENFQRENLVFINDHRRTFLIYMHELQIHFNLSTLLEAVCGLVGDWKTYVKQCYEFRLKFAMESIRTYSLIVLRKIRN